MKQIELTSKLVLAIIGLTSVSAILVPTYAAPQIRSADIVDGEVKTNDIATNAVTSAKIKDGEVKNADIATSAVTADKIKAGEIKSGHIEDGTIQAVDIAPGVIPSSSSGGTIERFIRGTETQSVSPGSTAIINAFCEPGEMSIGATFHSLVVGAKLLIVQYEPVSSDATGERIHGWHTTVENIGTESANFNSRAICIKVTS
jgi:hypothetical protein